MLVDDTELLAFCTLSQKKYDINSELSPWLGCVYTFPKYRGNRYSEKLMQYAEKIVGNIPLCFSRMFCIKPYL